MVSIDEIMKYEGGEVYPLICQLLLSDAANAMNIVEELKASPRYKEESAFRVSVDSGSMVAHGLRGDHEAVIAMAPEIINQADALGMHKLVASNWNNLGTTYVVLQNLERSLECYCHVVNNMSKHGNYGLNAMAYYNLSCIFYDVGARDKAVMYIEKAVDSLNYMNLEDVASPRYMLFNSLYMQLLCRTGHIEQSKALYEHLSQLVNSETARESILCFRAAKLYFYFYNNEDRSDCEYYYERLMEMVDEHNSMRKYQIIFSYIELCELFQMDYKYYQKQILLIEDMPNIHSYPVMTELYGWLRKYYLKTGQTDKFNKTTEKYIFVLEESQKNYREQQLHSLESVESIVLGMSNDFSARNVELKLLANEAIQNKKALEEAYRKLEKLSSLDGLTHISGRRDFDQRFIGMLQFANKKHVSVAIFMMDIDHFKVYNDTYGHLEGDEILKLVAVKFNDALESVGGLAARFGGEEFIGACTGLSFAETEDLAEKICESVRVENIENKNTPLKIVTVSVGAVVGHDFSVEDKSRFMKMADVSLYEAKNSGRNKIVCKELHRGDEKMQK